jgi:hypothetical protein
MKRTTRRFALCVDNTDYRASLIVGKVYRIIPDAAATRDRLLRVVDEDGEDYLYDRSYFMVVDLPGAVASKIRSLEAAKR